MLMKKILQSAPISDKTGNQLDCEPIQQPACFAQTADYNSFTEF